MHPDFGFFNLSRHLDEEKIIRAGEDFEAFSLILRVSPRPSVFDWFIVGRVRTRDIYNNVRVYKANDWYLIKFEIPRRMRVPFNADRD